MILLVVGILLSIPMLRKPLSEDDGKWFYLAVFWNRGTRLFKNIYSHGYFGIPWIFSIIYNIFHLRNLSAFYYFKAIWYSLTAISIYWLTLCFWHNHTLSFIAGLLFIIITAIPNTLFVLTYAEHCFILPINLSMIFTYYGITSGDTWYFILVGLMSSWAFQFKPTVLLFNVLLPFIFYFAPNPVLSIIYYTSAFLSLYFLPLIFFKKYGERARHLYLKNTLGPILNLIDILSNKFSVKFSKKLMGKIGYSEINKAYTKQHYQKNINVQWLSFKRFMLPAIKDLYLIIILAAVQVSYLFMKFDLLILSVVLLFVVFLLMQQVQRNYYTPHFNPCWAPISILAAKTMWDMYPYLLNSGVLGWTMMVFLGIESIKIGNIIVKSFSKSQRNIFGYLGPMLGMLFRLPETIGKYIQQNSKEKEKLFVWGDQPSIYLYARREAFDTTSLLLYAHQGQILKEKEILDSIRKTPPELLIFYNYKVNDGWNINKLQDAIGIPYNLVKSFKITDNQGRTIKDQRGIILDFPLYRRDDSKYKEILLDRAMIAKKNGGANSAQKHLEGILKILPKSFEASIRLSMMRNNTCDVDSARSYLNKQSAENHNTVENAILLRLRAEIEVATGNTDGAMRNYKRALDSNPNDFRIHNGLGGLHYSIGKPEEAFKSFRKALELHPYSSDVLNNIGVLLSQAGKREDAVKCFQKALSLMPSNPDARENLKALGLYQKPRNDSVVQVGT
jgi:tetratricopeptide (TPR) repeat protein